MTKQHKLGEVLLSCPRFSLDLSSSFPITSTHTLQDLQQGAPRSSYVSRAGPKIDHKWETVTKKQSF